MNQKVGLIWSPDIEKYDYGEEHPMKMSRASMVYDMLTKYNIMRFFDIYVD